MRRQAIFGSALLVLGMVGRAVAQESGARIEPSEPVRFVGGFDGHYAMATGELGEAFDHGWGGAGRISMFKGTSPLGLSLDGWLGLYGNESERRRLFPDTDRILVDIDTTNWMAHMSIGPEIARRAGPIRPYLRGLVGFTYFATSSSVEGSSDDDDFATTTHQDDWNLSLAAVAGVRIPFQRDGSLALDLNARYVWNGEAEYLVKGDIREASDGSLLFDPRRSQANLLLFGVGLSFGR